MSVKRTMLAEVSWTDFWNESVESANEAIRFGKILSDGTFNDDDHLNHEIYNYYIKMLKVIDKELSKNLSKSQSVYSRLMAIDIYHEYDVGDQINSQCFTSCFKGEKDPTFGTIEVSISVPQNFPILEYDNTVILPPGIFTVMSKGVNSYEFQMMEFRSIFPDLKE